MSTAQATVQSTVPDLHAVAKSRGAEVLLKEHGPWRSKDRPHLRGTDHVWLIFVPHDAVPLLRRDVRTANAVVQREFTDMRGKAALIRQLTQGAPFASAPVRRDFLHAFELLRDDILDTFFRQEESSTLMIVGYLEI